MDVDGRGFWRRSLVDVGGGGRWRRSRAEVGRGWWLRSVEVGGGGRWLRSLAEFGGGEQWRLLLLPQLISLNVTDAIPHVRKSAITLTGVRGHHPSPFISESDQREPPPESDLQIRLPDSTSNS